MSDDITASWATLMRQAGMTAHTYLLDAEEHIDSVFGEGFARAHPELICAYIQTCAIDFHASTLGVKLQELRDALSDNVATAILEQSVAPELEEIATVLKRRLPKAAKGRGR